MSTFEPPHPANKNESDADTQPHRVVAEREESMASLRRASPSEMHAERRDAIGARICEEFATPRFVEHAKREGSSQILHADPAPRRDADARASYARARRCRSDPASSSSTTTPRSVACSCER